MKEEIEWKDVNNDKPPFGEVLLVGAIVGDETYTTFAVLESLHENKSGVLYTWTTEPDQYSLGFIPTHWANTPTLKAK